MKALYAGIAPLLLTLLVLPQLGHAQGAFEDKNPITFIRQIKQLDEFMQRFNREVPPEGVDPTMERYDEKMLLSLFDFDYAQQHEAEVLQFIQTTVAQGARLHYSDTGWCAWTLCNAVIDKRSTTLHLRLQVEFTSPTTYKWVIAEAVGDELMLPPKRVSKHQKLLPLENEINFMQLNTITSRNAEDILRYAPSDYKVDPTSTFFALVASHRLRIESVEELHYLFQTRDYRFSVKFFARETSNSGWLIYNIEKK